MKRLIFIIILILLNNNLNSLTYIKEIKELRLKHFKLNKHYSHQITPEQLTEIIDYCNANCTFDPNIVIVTIYRESTFNPNAFNSCGDKGLGQFNDMAIKYHNLNKDSIFHYLYNVKAIIKRYNDIITKLKPKSDKELIAAYGSYNRVRNNDTIAINKSYKLFIKKQKELEIFKIY